MVPTPLGVGVLASWAYPGGSVILFSHLGPKLTSQVPPKSVSLEGELLLCLCLAHCHGPWPSGLFCASLILTAYLPCFGQGHWE